LPSPTEVAGARSLAKALDLHPVAAEILARRGIADAGEAGGFLGGKLADLPDPALFLGMDAAVGRAIQAIRRRERIVAYGDYDVDGVSATSLFVSFFRDIGVDVGWTVPHRLREGYGLNPAQIERLAREGARLLFTLDCGVTQVAEIELAKSHGIDVVVVDHHRVSPDLPQAVAILNPLQPGCRFPTRELCAAGVTFFFLAALRRQLRLEGYFQGRREPNLREALDLVALATIADVVPLRSVNRVLVREGLKELDRRRRPGLAALMTAAGIASDRPVRVGQVGFRLAPRINAAGRLDDAGRAVRLVLLEDGTDAGAQAAVLERENEQRRALEATILAQALEQANRLLSASPTPTGLVLSSPEWHPGVVGIVASRVVEQTGRPAILLAEESGQARGSGRSVAGFDLHRALQGCGDLLSRHGGHSAAVGLTLPLANLAALRERFAGIAAAELDARELGPRCQIDALVDPAAISSRLAGDLERLGPFGLGNPEPVLAAMGLRGDARVLQAKVAGAEDHLRLQLRTAAGSLDAIGFGLAKSAPLCAGPIDAAFCLELDEWRGERRLQLRLRALRQAA
jgi:single-stranded-DNA-specific exonuclease